MVEVVEGPVVQMWCDAEGLAKGLGWGPCMLGEEVRGNGAKPFEVLPSSSCCRSVRFTRTLLFGAHACLVRGFPTLRPSGAHASAPHLQPHPSCLPMCPSAHVPIAHQPICRSAHVPAMCPCSLWTRRTSAG